jgi:DNA mismatch repair protein MutH
VTRRAAPPPDEATLLAAARRLAGRTVRQLAADHGRALPDLRRAKGFLGQLLEDALGATAGSRALPDFPHLGVELKTLPVDPTGRPLESTFVCTASLTPPLPSWPTSWVREKLRRVLWIPVVQAASGDAADRPLGAAFLWTPTPEQDAALAADWEEIAAILSCGETWLLTGRLGAALQLRPKGARAADAAWTTDEAGEPVLATKRGFYLRPSFTAAVLRAALRVAPR